MPRVLNIRTFPDKLLRSVSNPVKALDKTTKAFIHTLIETMYAQPGGIGIAAPQVGVLTRIAIVDVSRKVPGADRLVLINPEVTKMAKKRPIREGCMSLPHYTANVARWDQIEVKWTDITGHIRCIQTTGLEAICIQHEVDHLNGLLFIDRVSSLKRDVFRRKRYL